MATQVFGVSVKNPRANFRTQSFAEYFSFYLESSEIMEVAKTPYEEYLRQSIINERARLDSLYNEFAKSNSLRKQILKRSIDEVLQNIDLLTNDLDKYRSGLSWLREPSKERDEKAEHLPKLEKEAPAPAPAKPAAPAGQPARPVVIRPTIGKPVGASAGSATLPRAQAPVSRPEVGAPVGTPRSTVGTSVGTARPKIGTPVGTPVTQAPAAQPPANSNQPAPVTAQGLQQPVQRPTIGTPVKRPMIGTPIGKPKPAQDTNQQEASYKDTEENGRSA